MRIVGYCEQCRRVRYVRVGSRGLAMVAANQIAVGICSDCETEQERRRKDGNKST